MAGRLPHAIAWEAFRYGVAGSRVSIRGLAEPSGGRCLALPPRLLVLDGAIVATAAVAAGAFARGARVHGFLCPPTLEALDANCFLENSDLRILAFDSAADSRLASVGAQAFARSGLDSIALPPSIAAVAASAFAACDALGCVLLPRGGAGVAFGPKAFANSAIGPTSSSLKKSSTLMRSASRGAPRSAAWSSRANARSRNSQRGSSGRRASDS
jgi:hypothetical protein